MSKKELPLLPLRGLIVFPNMVLHLDVGREGSKKALDEAMLRENLLLLVTQKEAQIDEPKNDDLYLLGTIVNIKQMLKLPGGTIRVLVEGLSRAQIKDFLHSKPYIKVMAEEVEEKETKTAEIEALTRSILLQFEQYIKLSKKIPVEVLSTVTGIEEPGRLADIVASHLTLKIEQKQNILEAVDPKKRLEILAEILNREMEILEMERKINLRVRKLMEKTQKEYYLREQIKASQ